MLKSKSQIKKYAQEQKVQNYTAMHTPVWLGQTGKLRWTRHKGRNSAVQSIQLTWTGQYKKYVQYKFKFTMYSDQLSKWKDLNFGCSMYVLNS